MNDNACWRTNLNFNGPETFNTVFKTAETFRTTMDEVVEIATGGQILSNTTEGWNSQVHLISASRTIYVYTDHLQEEDGEGNTISVPGLKVGDGKAYLIDLPFTDDPMIKHIADASIHVTQEEKEFWNNKVRVYQSQMDPEKIVFTTD